MPSACTFTVLQPSTTRPFCHHIMPCSESAAVSYSGPPVDADSRLVAVSSPAPRDWRQVVNFRYNPSLGGFSLATSAASLAASAVKQSAGALRRQGSRFPIGRRDGLRGRGLPQNHF